MANNHTFYNHFIFFPDCMHVFLMLMEQRLTLQLIFLFKKNTAQDEHVCVIFFSFEKCTKNTVTLGQQLY